MGNNAPAMFFLLVCLSSDSTGFKRLNRPRQGRAGPFRLGKARGLDVRSNVVRRGRQMEGQIAKKGVSPSSMLLLEDASR
jgi:hypothetical protein